MGGESEPLFYPCKCSGTSFYNLWQQGTCNVCMWRKKRNIGQLLTAGSMRYVHQACLNQWLQHSGHKQCEASENYVLLPVILQTGCT